MSRNRGNSGIAQAWYSAYRFQLDDRKIHGKVRQLAPALDIDAALLENGQQGEGWCWYDRGRPVALLDVKFHSPRGKEIWTWDTPQGNGLRALAALADGCELPAFVLVVKPHALTFGFVALNVAAHNAILRFYQWAHARGRLEEITWTGKHPDTTFAALVAREWAHWHLEMMVRAGDQEHDAAVVDRRLETMRRAPLPQRHERTRTVEAFVYGPGALEQRPRSDRAPLEPITAGSVSDLRELLLAQPEWVQAISDQVGHDPLAMLDAINRVAAAALEPADSNVVVLERIRERRALLELRANSRTPEETADELRELLRNDPLRGLRTMTWNLHPEMLNAMSGLQAVGQQITARYQGIGREMERIGALTRPLAASVGPALTGLNAVTSRQRALLEVLGVDPDDDSAA